MSASFDQRDGMTAHQLRSKVTRLFLFAGFGILYIYGIFLSDAALYVKVPNPNPTNNGQHAGDKYVVYLRSLPHLRAVNTLTSYKKRTKGSKQQLRKRNDLDPAPPLGDSVSSNSTSSQGSGTNIHSDNTLKFYEILYPVLALILLSLSCRCLLAYLIYRHSNQIHDFDFDSSGQLQRRSRMRPSHERISFWQAFRTIQTRQRPRAFQPPPRQNRTELISILTNRLNQQRMQNGTRPLGAESLDFLLSGGRTRDNFSGNDYDALWAIQEDNGNYSSLQASRQRGPAVTDEDLARYPVRYLEEGDDLLQNHKSAHLTENGNQTNSQDGTNSEMESGRCSICLEDFQIGDSVRTIPCFHEFHMQCIDRWLREQATCPICKHDTTEPDNM